MGCGSNTTTTSSQPPAAVQQAYSQVMGQATNVANQPLQQYAGPLVSGFAPDQLRAMGTIDATQGITQPYINQAAAYMQNAASPIQPMQYSGQTINSLMSPYIGDVANATEAQFNQQNQVQQEQLMGNAVSQGAFGGDRMATAQALLAGQQQLNEAPTIANLYNTGYGQAQGEFNALNQAGIGAQEATGWLQQGAGYGVGNLGTEAQQAALTGANAQLQTGGLQQQLAQEQLNIPYQQFTQQQAYPFQTTGWLGNIAEGIGSNLGGTSSTTSPGPSVLGQVAGLGTAGLGFYNAINGINDTAGGAADAATNFSGGADIPTMSWARGGRIPRGYAAGGLTLPAIPLVGGIAGMGINGGGAGEGIPDVSLSIIPAGAAGGGSKTGQMSPLAPVTTTSGGGGSNIAGDIGAAASIAKLATMFLADGGRVPGYAPGGAAPAPNAPGSGLPGAPAAYSFTPQPVDPNVSVAVPVHAAAPTFATLPTIAAPSGAGPLNMAQITPSTSYAPTFDPVTNSPTAMKAVTPGFSAAPLSIPISNGVLQTPAQVAAAQAAAQEAAAQQAAAQQNFIYTPPVPPMDSGGSGRRGGRIGERGIGHYDGGGSVPSIPDLSLGYVPATASNNIARGSGPPKPPQVAQQPAADPAKDAASLTSLATGIGKLFKDDGNSDKSLGGPVDTTGAYRGYDDGGAVQQAGQAYSGGASPTIAGSLSQYLQMSMEQLQELAMRAKAQPNSIQSQLIQRALQMKQMNPTAGQQAPAGAPTAGMAPSAGQGSVSGFASPTSGLAPGLSGATAWRGGRQGFDDGGLVSPATADVLAAHALADRSDMSPVSGFATTVPAGDIDPSELMRDMGERYFARKYPNPATTTGPGSANALPVSLSAQARGVQGPLGGFSEVRGDGDPNTSIPSGGIVAESHDQTLGATPPSSPQPIAYRSGLNRAATPASDVSDVAGLGDAPRLPQRDLAVSADLSAPLDLSGAAPSSLNPSGGVQSGSPAVGGITKSGWRPDQVLGAFTGANFDKAPVYISSGVSNDPSRIDLVPEQIKAARAGGASQVNLYGVGTGVANYKNINERLSQIAADNGAQFIPLVGTEGGRVHPTAEGYSSLAKGVTPGAQLMGDSIADGIKAAAVGTTVPVPLPTWNDQNARPWVQPGRPSAGDPRGMIPVIRDAAIRNHVDPDIAVQVARSEGLGQFTSGFPGENSYTAMQLNVSGIPGRPSMGDLFKRDTRLDPADPKNEVPAIYYAMAQVPREGWTPFHGAARSGISTWAGITDPAPTTGNITTHGGAPRRDTPEDQVLTAKGGDLSSPVAASYVPASTPAQRHPGFGASPWLPVIAAGLGMMASRSPHPLTAIGEGGLAGIRVAQQQETEAQKLEATRNEAANRQATLGLEAARLNQTTSYQGRELALRGLEIQKQLQTNTIAQQRADTADRKADLIAERDSLLQQQRLNNEQLAREREDRLRQAEAEREAARVRAEAAKQELIAGTDANGNPGQWRVTHKPDGTENREFFPSGKPNTMTIGQALEYADKIAGAKVKADPTADFETERQKAFDQASHFVPGYQAPPAPGLPVGAPRNAQPGKTPDGKDGWFVPDPSRPGKYLQWQP